MSNEMFNRDSCADTITIDYADMALVEKALGVLDGLEVGLFGYGYRGWVFRRDLKPPCVSLVFERYSMNGDGFHVGTEVCTVKAPYILRDTVGFVNEAKVKVDDSHRFVMRLDDSAWDLYITPATDECADCEHKDEEEDDDCNHPCNDCSPYLPMGEEEWWEMEVKALVEKLRAEVQRWTWEYVKDTGWKIVPVLANPASHTSPDHRA